jgi:tetratricopeptide (TPR) repeat protein
MAHEAARQGNTQGAIAQYREALKLDTKIPGLHFELAEALNGSELPGDRQEMERQYKAALTVNPFGEKSECRLGDIAACQSDLKAAAAHYSRALKLQPNDADANLGLAKILMSMHQPQEAEAHLEHAAELDPFNPAHYRLGVLYRELGRTSDSQRELAEFEKLKKMKIRLSNIYQGMRLQTGKRDEAAAGIPE